MTDAQYMQERQSVLTAAHQAAGNGLISGSNGNVSTLVSSTPLLVAITPSQRNYSSLTLDDILIVDDQGEPLVGALPPSSETLLHLTIYRNRKDVRAILHTHSVYATICAVVGIEIPPIMDEMVVMIGGAIRVAKYAFPGTEDLAEQANTALNGRNAVLLSMHGMVGVGKDLEHALTICQLTERAAQVYVWSRLLGNPQQLPEEIVQVETAIYEMSRQSEEV